MVCVILAVVIYLVGVFLALVGVAMYNAKRSLGQWEFPFELCFLSWLVVLAVLIAASYATVEKLYNVMYKWFERK